jgi:hypothetical protein
VEKKLNAASPLRPKIMQRRCSFCGKEWESGHYEEVCPLEELERSFLSADWFFSTGSRLIPTDGMLRVKT